MPGPRVLITGACGFTGRHLVENLRRDASRVIIGLDTLAGPTVPGDNYLHCDLTQPRSVDDAIRAARPNVVFHLAGLMGHACADEIRRVNVGGFICLMDALRRQASLMSCPLRVVTIGSAAEIGSSGAAMLPVTEDACCKPETPYGQSKWEVTRLALAEPATGPLQVVVARPFNLVGPGLSPRLSLGNFARQIAAAVRGECDEIRCGPLDTRRDFVDVRDAVEAYVALAEHGRPGQVYNVCAGRSCRLGDLLDRLVALAGVKVRIVLDGSGPRPGDLPDIYGDHSKITREVGWRPTVPMEKSLADLLAGVPLLRPASEVWRGLGT